MRAHINLLFVICIAALIAVGCGDSGTTSAGGSTSAAGTVDASFEDLVELFREFRSVETPTTDTGLPDYTVAAMSRQREQLDAMQARLVAMDISDWPVDQQVDYHLVRAEMNGLDFYHRVLRPWSRDPGFYLQTQAGAGPVRGATVRIRNLPLDDEQLDGVRQGLEISQDTCVCVGEE